MPVRFLHMGDSALTLELGDHIERGLAARVTALDHRLSRELAAGRLTGLIEAVPTYRSLTVIFDPQVLSREALKTSLLSLLAETEKTVDQTGRCWQLPVCYEEEYGPDLATVAAARGLTTAQVVHLHSSRTYTVYMIGFLPGFPYMGDLDPALHMPRRKVPRVRVAVGSVAIVGGQTAIYPWVSPGGWQILGGCPVPLFNAQSREPALLAQGDRVQFAPVSAAHFRSVAAAAQNGSIDMTQFLVSEVST